MSRCVLEQLEKQMCNVFKIKNISVPLQQLGVLDVLYEEPF